MTSFNNAAFRTQAWESDLNLQTDRMRAQSNQNLVNTIVGAARDIRDTQMAKQERDRQFAESRRRYDQDFELRRQGMAREFANIDRQFQEGVRRYDQDFEIRATDSANRVQQHEMNMQMQAAKLQQLQSIDFAEQSLQATRAAQLQNKMLEQQIAAAKAAEARADEQYEEQKGNRSYNRRMQTLNALDLFGVADAGKKVVLQPDGSITFEDFKSEEEKTQYIQRLIARKQMMSSGGMREDRYRVAELRQQLNQLLGTYYRNGRLRAPGMSEDQKQAIEEQKTFLEGQLRAYQLGQGGLPMMPLPGGSSVGQPRVSDSQAAAEQLGGMPEVGGLPDIDPMMPGGDPGAILEDQNVPVAPPPQPTAPEPAVPDVPPAALPAPGEGQEQTVAAEMLSPADQQIELPQEVQQMAAVSYQELMRRGGPVADTWANLPEDSRGALLIAMGTMANDLVANGYTTPAMAPSFVLEAVNGNSTQTAYFLKLAGYSNEQIRAVLLARGATEDAVDYMMASLQKGIDRARENEQKGGK